jgi:two-component system NtrC family sensor kinase
MVNRSPEIKSIWIFDARGHALVNNLVSPAPSIDFSDRDYFKVHVENMVATYVGQTLRPREPYGGAPFFGVSARRAAAKGEFAGIIQVSILPEYFEGFYGKISRASGSYHSLIRSDGFILARFPALGVDKTLPRKGPVMEAMQANSSAGMLTATSLVDGVKRAMSYRRLSGLPVYVLSGRETDAIRNEWLWHEAQRLQYGLPLTAALVLMIAFALRRTKRMYAEEHKRKVAEDALRQAQRLEALGRLTGGVAHDFNNLLMVVRGGAGKLRRLALDPKAYSAVQLIDEAAKKGESLTRRLLAFSRDHSLAPKVFDLGEQLVLIRGVLEQSIRGNIVLDIVKPDYPVFVKLDPDDLEISLLNLALNSRDAMPDGGKITIGLRVDTEAGAPAALITFSDTGLGIPLAIHDRIFEPFFTTKTVDKGTGLGLSQVYGFVSQSKGTLRVESASGAGATFKVWLPLTDERPASETPPPIRVRTPLAASRVLLVEDNKAVAEVASDYLEQLDLGVVHASSAEAAITLLNAQRGIDFVLTDIVMPGMTGLELGRLIREHHPELPVILATGYSDQANVATTENFPLINKPYSLENLERVIRECVGQVDARFKDAG